MPEFMPIKEYSDQQAVAEAFANWFSSWVGSFSSSKSKITISLSGGSTPKLLFELWADEYRDTLPWNRIHFFWGDERCVPPDNPESNYGEAKRLFLNNIQIRPENVHRIRGESDPQQEAQRYSDEIRAHVELDDDEWPVFDLIILGMGGDGHTASIFPDQMELLRSEKICEVATHPVTGQKRITMTGRVLNSASFVTFLVVGEEKRSALSAVLGKRDGFEGYPTSYVEPSNGNLLFFIDQAAADGTA